MRDSDGDKFQAKCHSLQRIYYLLLYLLLLTRTDNVSSQVDIGSCFTISLPVTANFDKQKQELD